MLNFRLEVFVEVRWRLSAMLEYKVNRRNQLCLHFCTLLGKNCFCKTFYFYTKLAIFSFCISLTIGIHFIQTNIKLWRSFLFQCKTRNLCPVYTIQASKKILWTKFFLGISQRLESILYKISIQVACLSFISENRKINVKSCSSEEVLSRWPVFL